MNEQMNDPISPKPIGISGWFSIWIMALTKPNEQTYISIAKSPNARFSTALLWFFVGSFVQVFLNVVAVIVSGPIGGEKTGIGVLLVSLFGLPVALTIAFTVIAAVTQWIAKMFGGVGNLDQMAYVLAATWAPYSIVIGILSMFAVIPYVGRCINPIGLLVLIFLVVVDIVAVKSVNNFGWGQAIGSFMLPTIILMCCLTAPISIAVMRLLGPTVGNTFSTIQNSLP